MQTPPVVLTIAGSDCSCGAGIQADLKTFAAHGTYGLTALTCVVAEVPGEVAAILPVRLNIVRSQIKLLLERFPIRAIKTGMLHTREVVELVAELLEPYRKNNERRIPLVVDPVMVSSSGEPLLDENAVEAYCEILFPLADLVTPNLDEAEALSGTKITDYNGMKIVGQQLRDTYRSGFLIKGGHLKGDTATDLLLTHAGTFRLESPREQDIHTHGTGCTYSAAIAANLAHGLALEEAVGAAKRYITHAINGHFRWEDPKDSDATPMDALDHFASKPDPVEITPEKTKEESKEKEQ